MDLTNCVLASGLTRELSANGPLVVLVILSITALFLALTLAAERLVETFLLWALFVVPFTAVVPALHPESQNYAAYYAIALFVFAAITILKRRQPPTIDIGVVFFSYLVCSWLLFAASAPLARTYYPLIIPLTELAMYMLVINRPLARTEPILLRGIVALGTVEALIGLSQSLFGRPVFAQVLPALWTSDRGYMGYLIPSVSKHVTQGSGTFEHFNGLGALLVLSACMAFGDWLSHQRSLWRLSVFWAIFAGVVTTYSRGALLGTFAGCVVVWWLSARRSSRHTVVAVLCASAVGGVLASGALLRYYSQTQNLTSRLSTWSYAIRYVIHHPSSLLLGTGYSSFAKVILPATTGQASGPLLVLHSGPLQVLLELGIFGFALYLAMVLVPIARSIYSPWSATRAVLIGATVGFLVAELFDNATFGDPAISGPAGVVMFALIALLRRDLIEASAEHGAYTKVRVAELQSAGKPNLTRSA